MLCMFIVRKGAELLIFGTKKIIFVLIITSVHCRAIRKTGNPDRLLCPLDPLFPPTVPPEGEKNAIISSA